MDVPKHGCFSCFGLCRLMEEITHQLWWCLLQYFNRLFDTSRGLYLDFFYQHEALLQLLRSRKKKSKSRKRRKKSRSWGYQLEVEKNIHFFDVFPVNNYCSKHPLKIDGWKMIHFPFKHDTFLRGHSFLSFLASRLFSVFGLWLRIQCADFFWFPPNFHQVSHPLPPQATRYLKG